MKKTLFTLLLAVPFIAGRADDITGDTINIYNSAGQSVTPNFVSPSTGAVGSAQDLTNSENSIFVGTGNTTEASSASSNVYNSIFVGTENQSYTQNGYATNSSLVVGSNNSINLYSGFVAGEGNQATDGSLFVLGRGLRAYNNDLMIVMGSYNLTPAAGELFVLGNGTATTGSTPVITRSNALDVTTDGKLRLFASAAATPSIILDPAAATIKINGNSVLTSASTANLLFGDGSATMSSNWKGGAAFGNSGNDKVILGPLASSYTGATIAGHNSALNAWANLNIAGSNLIFRTNGETEAARLTSSGNLGIGTTNPIEKLQLNGRILAGYDRGIVTNSLFGISSGGSANFMDLISSQFGVYGFGGLSGQHIGSPVIYMYDNANYGNSFTVGKVAYTANPATALTPLFTVLNTGNVGIGTTAPASSFDIRPAATATDNGAAFRIVDPQFPPIPGNSTQYALGQIQFSPIYGQASVLSIGRRYTSAAPAITTDGSILGTLLFNGSGSDGWTFRKGAEISAVARTNFWGNGSWPTDLAFYVNPGTVTTTLSEAMRINSLGNVGIGTTTPQSQLSVQSGALDASTSSDRGFNSVFAFPNKLSTSGTNAGQVAIIANNATPTADFGGSLSFGAVYDSSAHVAINAGIRSGRDNATSGNYGGYLSFLTRPQGAGPTERMRITSGGVVNLYGSSPTSPTIILDPVTPKITVGGVAMAATTNGNLGVGTAGAPGFKLSVYGTGGTQDVYQQTASDGNTGVRVQSGSTSAYAFNQLFQGASGMWEYGSDNSNNFYIQNATNSGSTNSEFVINRSSGNVGIGTTAPAAKLDVTGDSGVIFSGAFNPSATLPVVPTSASTSQFIWYPKKAAFLGGTGVATTDADIGQYSFAFGGSSRATGDYSVAFGSSSAAGYGSIATGFASASGRTSVATGESYAAGESSSAFGSATAIGVSSSALGSSTANGDYSVALGGYYPTAQGGHSLAFGDGIVAESFGGIVLGRFNRQLGTSATAWVDTDPLFVLGNGTGVVANLADMKNHNALVVTKEGKMSLYPKGTASNILANPTIVLDPNTSQIFVGGQPLVTTTATSSTFSAPSFSFNSGGTPRVTIDTAGNLAVGNVPADGRLRVGQGDVVLDSSYYYRAAGGDGVTGLRLSSAEGAEYVSLYTHDEERLHLSGNGNVGIGTTSPQAVLHVNNSTAASGLGAEVLRIGSLYNGSTLGSGGYISFTDANNTALGQIRSILEANLQVGLSFSTYNSGLAERMRITNSGNVGIGTTAPFAKLDIRGPNGTGARPALAVSGDGGIMLGYGLSQGEAGQVAVGRYNNNYTNDVTSTPAATDHSKGVFVVGVGTGGTFDNALRVLSDGTVLVKPSGDIPMTGFMNGPRP